MWDEEHIIRVDVILLKLIKFVRVRVFDIYLFLNRSWKVLPCQTNNKVFLWQKNIYLEFFLLIKKQSNGV